MLGLEKRVEQDEFVLSINENWFRSNVVLFLGVPKCTVCSLRVWVSGFCDDIGN